MTGALPLDGYTRWDDLKWLVPLSFNTVRNRERAGRFPKRVKLGSYSVAWPNREIHRWLADPDGYRVVPESAAISEKSNSVATNISMDAATRSRLHACAVRSGVPMARIIKEALAEYVERHGLLKSGNWQIRPGDAHEWANATSVQADQARTLGWQVKLEDTNSVTK
ncbi:AlpA family phage regulatory protein [Burkholderia pseudomallei]|uniref:AlpA family phage regulatory protein n=1 Tax=Burkholderia pseudomallei TaxID=28450 RepID=UPI000A1C9241